MNQAREHEISPALRTELFVEYNNSFNRAISTHFYGSKVDRSDDIAAMTDAEFLEEVLSVDRQPINPWQVMRETLGYEEGASSLDVLHGLRQAYNDLVADYEAHGVDGRTALANAINIIGHTEAYITGYSREIGILNNQIRQQDASLNGPARWHDKIWVPQEDGHDRLWSLLTLASSANMEAFGREHIRHLQIGTHLDIEDSLETLVYVTLQERSTGPSYGHIAKLLGPVLFRPSFVIKGDEDRHTREYASVTGDMLQVDPDATITILEKESDEFGMPGQEGIEDFESKAMVAGLAGVLDPVIILKLQRSLYKRIALDRAQPKTDIAKRSQERLLDSDGPYSEAMLIKRQGQMERIRARAVEKARKDGRLLPAILGVTVDADPLTRELSFPMAA